MFGGNNDSQQTGGYGGMFGSYGAADPTMNVGVTSGANSVMSPYLNFDPATLGVQQDSQYIFPEGATGRRGRFELAFSQIGCSVMAGGLVGGLRGTYTGRRECRAAQLTGPVWRTQMLNYVGKQSASSAQALGAVALMYSLFGVGISKARGVDDELNTVAAGTATGLLFKSAAGLRQCAAGGLVGAAVAATYVLVTGQDKVQQLLGLD